MKVLHVLTTDQRRGAETSAVTLRDELRRRGHDASAVALVASGQDRTLDVPTLGTRHRLSPGVLAGLRRRAKAADVVIAHGSTTLPACAVALSGRNSPPFVYANIGDPLYWANRRCRVRRVSFMLRQARGVAARSQRAAEDIHRVLGVSVDAIAVIPNGRDVSRYTGRVTSQQPAARRRLGLPESPMLALALGSLSPEKRVDIAIEAMGRMQKVHLVVAGEGPQRSVLEESAARIAPGRVHFLGTVDDVPRLLAAVDVLVLTSDSEGLPGALIEAGLAGLPVVATNVGFVDDIVRHGETGLLVDRRDVAGVANALEAALLQKDELGARARMWCLEEFDMRMVAGRWESLLQTVLQQT